MISVVIPTYNRAHELDKCLESLRAQKIDSSLFEVVVVDDGSTDNTSEVLGRWTPVWPVLRSVRQTNAGPAAARNTGVRNARSAIIAFIDDDCIAPPDWIARIQQHFAPGFAGCLYGPVHSSLPASTFVHSVVSEGSMITANLAIQRAALDDLGGLDPRFHQSSRFGMRPAHWCEDEDLFYRIRKSGMEIRYDVDLIVEHPPRYDSFWSEFRKARALQFFGLIAAKHPEVEPLKMNRRRLQLAARKVLFITVAIAGALRIGVPWALAIPMSISPFILLDAWRLTRIKKSLINTGIHVTAADQV
jgi:glycosyltransferase involved in cell wall biosynthesis